MENRETLLQAIREQLRRFSDPRVARDFSRWNKTMQYHFTDTGDRYLVRFVDGQAHSPVPGEDPKPDIQYELASDTFMAIHRRELSGLKAYQQKKVKLKASMPDIMKLQKIDRL